MATTVELFFWVKVAPRTRTVQSRTIIWCLAHDDGTRSPKNVTVTLGPAETPAAGSGKDQYVVTAFSLDDREYTRAEAQAWIGTDAGKAFSEGSLVCSLNSVMVTTSNEPPVKPVGTLKS